MCKRDSEFTKLILRYQMQYIMFQALLRYFICIFKVLSFLYIPK